MKTNLTSMLFSSNLRTNNPFLKTHFINQDGIPVNMSFDFSNDANYQTKIEKVKKETGIDIIPFYVSFDGTTYQKEGVELKVEDFYHRVLAEPKVFPKTSLPPVNDFANRFRYHIERGLDVLCICISTKFSGSYNSACVARDLVLEEYPDANIVVINSIVNTCLQGLGVWEAARMKEDGYSLQEIAQGLDELKASGRIFFTIGSILPGSGRAA